MSVVPRHAPRVPCIRPSGSLRRIAGAILTVSLFATAGPAAADCVQPGQWATPEGGDVDAAALFAELAGADAVLLGETHNRMDHHRWQVGTLAALHGQRPDMVIGLEMLPRSAQPVLDDWVAGELNEEQFLQESDWYEHWGFNPRLYWPILHFARVHDVPLVALNAERDLVRRLGHEGWESVPADERDGVSAPADPAEAYREYLEEVLERHPAAPGGSDAFIGTQLAWDRMMAAAIADVIEAGGDEPPLVVGIIGSGHLEYGHGVPHQLADLGVDDTPVLLPRETDGACTGEDPDLARAVFGVRGGERFQPLTPMLGVQMERAEGGDGVEIRGVMPDSVAGAAGIETGDRLVEAGGRAVEEPADLQRIVQGVTPGTWLPVMLERNGEREEVIARFPWQESPGDMPGAPEGH